MKRAFSLLLTGAIGMMMLGGCAPQNSWDKLGTDKLSAAAVDTFGNHSITILGDSISHGANAIDIMNDSWVSIFKKAVNAKTGDENYGFTSAEGTLWNSAGTHTELHEFPTSNCGFKSRGEKGKGWTEYRSAELLGTKGLGSTAKDDWLEFAPKQAFTYFCVYYQSGSGFGSFTVGGSDGGTIADVSGNQAVDCKADADTFARTAYYDMTQLGSDNKIRITAQSNEEIIITGIGYYNKTDGVVVNNYSNSGLQFAGTGKAQNGDMTGLDDSIVDFACTSGTVIFSLGYNDGHFLSDYDLFKEKVDHMIEVVNANQVKLIVNDLCWNFDTGDGRYEARYPFMGIVKEELKRLADETGGIYLDQGAINGQAILDTITDGAHPSAEGHRMIADTLLEAVGLTAAEATA